MFNVQYRLFNPTCRESCYVTRIPSYFGWSHFFDALLWRWNRPNSHILNEWKVCRNEPQFLINIKLHQWFMLICLTNHELCTRALFASWKPHNRSSICPASWQTLKPQLGKHFPPFLFAPLLVGWLLHVGNLAANWSLSLQTLFSKNDYISLSILYSCLNWSSFLQTRLKKHLKTFVNMYSERWMQFVTTLRIPISAVRKT